MKKLFVILMHVKSAHSVALQMLGIEKAVARSTPIHKLLTYVTYRIAIRLSSESNAI